MLNSVGLKNLVWVSQFLAVFVVFGFGLVGFVVFSTVSGQGLRVQEAAGCRIQTKHA